MKIQISLNLSLMIDGKRVSIDPEILRCGLTNVVESLDLSAYGVQESDDTHAHIDTVMAGTAENS